MDKYALTLTDSGRVLSVTLERYNPKAAFIVEALPEGGQTDLNDYLFIEGKFIFSPLLKNEPVIKPSETEVLRADVDYIAIITGVEL